MKFAKAPWNISRDNTNRVIIRAGENVTEYSRVVCVVCNNSMANAKLIAEAPSMFKMMELLAADALDQDVIKKMAQTYINKIN